MNLSDLIDRLAERERANAATWWEIAALDAYWREDYRAIPARDGSGELYVARFWLTPPEPAQDPEDVWESADSVILHYIAKPDDDQALHDHPYDFTTTILSGGYDEFKPPMSWNNYVFPTYGPKYGARAQTFRAGDSARRLPNDLHAIGKVEPDTWTLFRTGPRIREWGFHPEGELWVPHREYLSTRRGAKP